MEEGIVEDGRGCDCIHPKLTKGTYIGDLRWRLQIMRKTPEIIEQDYPDHNFIVVRDDWFLCRMREWYPPPAWIGVGRGRVPTRGHIGRLWCGLLPQTAPQALRVGHGPF